MLVLFLIILYICFISVLAPPSGWRISHTNFWARQVVGGSAIRIFGLAKWLAELPHGFFWSAKWLAELPYGFFRPAKRLAGWPYGLEAPGEHFPELVAHLAPT